MKTLINIAIIFGLFFNVKAQIKSPLFGLNVKNEPTNTFKLRQNLRILDEVKFEMTPQFGNQFISRTEAKIAKINLKDYYDDFDFGLNFGLSYMLKNSLNLKAFYNFGMLKFSQSNSGKIAGPIMKLSIDYWF